MQTVNGRNEAHAALAAGATALCSPPYAACHAGLGYYRALIAALKQDFPHQPFTFTLCCGDNAALAYEALRLGFTSLHLNAEDQAQAHLEAIAKQQNATIRRPLASCT